MAEKPPVVLSVAGFDPSSGAGITADIKTIAAHGCYGIACITAMTVQSTAGVKKDDPSDPALVTETLEELTGDVEIAAVRIGMLGSGKVAEAVIDFLEGAKKGGSGNRPGKSRLSNVVLDPILKSSSGANLLDSAGTRIMIERLIPLADVMTAAAGKLHELGAAAVVVTGGHLDKAIDLLSFTTKRGVEQEIFKAERQRSNSTHGTGCAFATAMACHLALDRGLAEATLLAKTYVAAAISYGHPLGKGVGPVHHLYRMSQQRRAAGQGGGESN